MSLAKIDSFATSALGHVQDNLCDGERKIVDTSLSRPLLSAKQNTLHTLLINTPQVTTVRIETILSPIIKQLQRISKRIPEKKKCTRVREKLALIKSSQHTDPAIKPLFNKSISSLREKCRASTRQRIDKAVIEDNSDSEKKFNIFLERDPLGDLLRSPSDTVEICERRDNRNSDHLQAFAQSTRNDLTKTIRTCSNLRSSTHASPYTCQTSCTSPRLRVRRRPLHELRHRCSTEDHPLGSSDPDTNGYETRTFSKLSKPTSKQNGRNKLRARSRNILESNITSSFYSIKSGAKSVSSLVKPFPIIGSLLTKFTTNADAKTSPTNETLSLRIDNMPTPVLRRYLNPNTNAPIDAHVSSSLLRTRRSKCCLVSIQMQTYRISTSRKKSSYILISRRTNITNDELPTEDIHEPKMRQRDIRENSDFMRVAVMEKLMRKRGKLDNHRPGRARFALPPRTISVEPYEITEEGCHTAKIAFFPVTLLYLIEELKSLLITPGTGTHISDSETIPVLE